MHKPHEAAQLVSMNAGLSVHSPSATHLAHSSLETAASWHPPVVASCSAFAASAVFAAASALVPLTHTPHEFGQCFSMKLALRHRPDWPTRGIRNGGPALWLAHAAFDRAVLEHVVRIALAIALRAHGHMLSSTAAVKPPCVSSQRGVHRPHAVGHFWSMNSVLFSHSPIFAQNVQSASMSVQL